MLIKIKRSSL